MLQLGRVCARRAALAGTRPRQEPRMQVLALRAWQEPLRRWLQRRMQARVKAATEVFMRVQAQLRVWPALQGHTRT